jgi:hypothetical protein
LKDFVCRRSGVPASSAPPHSYEIISLQIPNV